MRQGCYCLFLSAGWELRSHDPWTWNRLRLSQKQSKDIGFDFYHCLSLPKLTPTQLGHCSPLWYLYPNLHLPTGTIWFGKHNYFQPPLKKSHIGNFFPEVCLILRIGHWYSKTSSNSPHSASVNSRRVHSGNLTDPFFPSSFSPLQFGKTLDTISICPGVGSRALLSISV